MDVSNKLKLRPRLPIRVGMEAFVAYVVAAAAGTVLFFQARKNGVKVPSPVETQPYSMSALEDALDEMSRWPGARQTGADVPVQGEAATAQMLALLNAMGTHSNAPFPAAPQARESAATPKVGA